MEISTFQLITTASSCTLCSSLFVVIIIPWCTDIPVVEVSAKKQKKSGDLTRTVILIISRRMKWTGFVARISEMKNAYRILVGKGGRL
jgi:hypothetical protein